MELPQEIWRNILINTKHENECNKLYEALPNDVKNDIRKDYEYHRKVIQSTMLFIVKNTIVVYIGDERKVLYEANEGSIYVAQFVPNTTLVVFGGSPGILFFMDYMTNNVVKKIQVNADSFKTIRFSNCGKYMAIACGINFFELYNLENDKKEIICIDEEVVESTTILKNLTLEFHKSLPLLLICAKWYQNHGLHPQQNRVIVYNYKTLERKQFEEGMINQVKFYFDSNKIDFSKNNTGIYTLDINKCNITEIVKYRWEIIDFVRYKNLIYFIKVAKDCFYSRQIVESYDLTLKKRIRIFQVQNGYLFNIWINQYGTQLLIYHSGGIKIIDIETKNIIKSLTNYDVIDESDDVFTHYYPTLWDFDIKNF